MKTTKLLLSLPLATTAVSTPIIAHRPVDPSEQYNGPEAWMFTLKDFSGEACPDFNATSRTDGYMPTRLDLGPIYNSSLSTYWWYMAFPWMQAQLNVNDTSRLKRMRCEFTIQYEQVTEYGGSIPVDKRTHRLKLHKNGSLILANYRLDKDVAAEWQVRYVDLDYGTVEVSCLLGFFHSERLG
jgi:hypothetical protein